MPSASISSFFDMLVPAAETVPARPLITLTSGPSTEDLKRLEAHHCGVLASDPNVIAACQSVGLDRRALFFRVSGADEEALRTVHGSCRYLIDTLPDIARLDELCAPLLTGGYLEEVAIRVRMHSDTGFTPDTIPVFGRLLRRSKSLAVRSVFLPFSEPSDHDSMPLPEAASAAFSMVKKLRSDLPCLFHSFCFEGLLGPLSHGDEALLHALQMLSSLNDTSLYADFFLS